ncbi:MAG: lactate racemase domain-containing protein [Desulfobacteraceae bacterium]
MPQPISLRYGETVVKFDIRSDADVYTVNDPVPRVDPAGFAKRLKAAIQRVGLDLTCPAVVVADKTRLCGYPIYLQVLLDVMVEHGVDPEAISIHIAYGTHPRQSDEASQKAYGSAYKGYRWVHHHCDKGPFMRLGETRRGTPVYLRQDLAGASCVITFGAISHHYFAGYGGGRKLIFPGLGKKESIYANHRLFLEAESRNLADGCRSGRLDGNPLAEDLAEVERFRPADLSIHGILNSRGEVCDLMVGEGDDLFRRACARHGEGSEVVIKRRYDLVVASCGGFPKDINFIQSHKAIHHAADFVRNDGTLIVLAECRDGIGSQTFLPWFGPGGWDAAFDALAHQYVGNGGTALAMMAKCRRIRIRLVTGLDAATVDRIGCDVISAAGVQGVMDRQNGSLAVVPNASLTVGATDME